MTEVDSIELHEVFSTPHIDDYQRYLGQSDDEEPEATSFEERDGRRAQLLDIGNTKYEAQETRETVFNEMRELLVSVNFFNSKLPLVSRLFCVLVVLASLVIVGASTYMIADQISSNRRIMVSDGSVCEGTPFMQGNFSSVNYSVTVFIVNAVFCVWFAVRGVNLEKAGNLICFVAASAFQVGRILYFCFGEALKHSFFSQESTALEGTLLASVGLLVLALLLTHAVFQRFGWLRYAKGVTQLRQIDQLHRHNRFDTAVKLDVFVSTNGLISVLFLVIGIEMRVAATVVISLTILLLVFFKTMIKRQAMWLLVLTIVVGVASPAFYLYAAISVLQDAENECFASVLSPCLQSEVCLPTTPRAMGCTSSWNYNVTVGTAGFASTNVNASFLATNASTNLGFVLCGCDNSCLRANIPQISAFIGGCCELYGDCAVRQQLRDGDKALMVAVTLIAVFMRVVSLSLGYSRRRVMDIPSVKEMFDRAERNLNELRSAALQLRSDR